MDKEHKEQALEITRLKEREQFLLKELMEVGCTAKGKSLSSLLLIRIR